MKNQEKQKEFMECFNLVLFLVMGCFFFGVIFGATIVAKNTEKLGEWLTYIGAPVAIIIPFFAWKAKSEMVIKLNQKQIEKIQKVEE